MQRTATLAEQDKFLGLFIHDDFKVNSRLTLNIGLRYEYESPVTERYDRSVAHFALASRIPLRRRLGPIMHVRRFRNYPRISSASSAA